MNDDPNNEFANKLKSTLNRSVDDIDDSTTRALQRIRAEAMQQPTKNERAWIWPSMAIAAVGVIAVTVVLQFNYSESDKALPTLFEDIELLSQNDELEMIDEMEMMHWLDEDELSV